MVGQDERRGGQDERIGGQDERREAQGLLARGLSERSAEPHAGNMSA